MDKTFSITTDREQIVLSQSGNYRIDLNKEGAQVEILGAFHIRQTEKLELAVMIHHKKPHTSATTHIKAVVAGQAQAKITGTIVIDQTASDSNSFLAENVLLLSSQAKAEAIPNLEIKTNDVKCSHAATIGEVDEDQLFYLMSRGIPSEQAKALIADAFLNEVKEKIN